MKKIIIILFIMTVTQSYIGCTIQKDLSSEESSSLTATNTATFADTSISAPANTPTIQVTEEPIESVTSLPTIVVATPDTGYDIIEHLSPYESFESLFIGHWSDDKKYPNFHMKDAYSTNGLGMFIYSHKMNDGTESRSAKWKIDGMYNRITFTIGCDDRFDYGGKEDYGTFSVEIYADDELVWKTGIQNYKYYIEDQEVILGQECEIMTIKLTQTKGEKGTLNIIMTDFKLHKS